MTTSTLPRVAALVWDAGPYYAARSILHAPDESNIVWLARPVLPHESFRWAEDAEVRREHVTLDAGAFAELVFISGADPDALDDDGVMAVADAMLRRLRCNMRECAAEVGEAMGEGRETTGALFFRCVTRTSRLLLGGAA